MAMSRILPLACAVWLLAFVSVTLHGAQAAETKQGGTARKPGHLDLSLFTPSENCVACHNNLITPDGEDVSIGATWRSTMMANSARDPYWQASIRRETIDHPMHSGDIQNQCSACHMPMLQKVSKAAGRNADVFA